MGDRGPKSFNELDMIARNRVSRTRNHLADSDSPADPPPHLSSETQAWWLAITADFNFEPHQHRLLQACAEAWDRKEQARLALSQFGLTYEDAKGVLRARPEVMIERDSRTAFTRLMRELDLEKVPPPGLHKPWDVKQSLPWERDV